MVQRSIQCDCVKDHPLPFSVPISLDSTHHGLIDRLDMMLLPMWGHPAYMSQQQGDLLPLMLMMMTLVKRGAINFVTKFCLPSNIE
jgi:hypothetical protein